MSIGAGCWAKSNRFAQVGVPVIAKEVGWGISAQSARRLLDAGVAAIDVAGSGGTSWSQVDAPCAHRASAAIAGAFADWGMSTAQSLQEVRQVRSELGKEDVHIFASGGIRSGLDIAKCVALGADLCWRGLSSSVVESPEAVCEEMALLEAELRVVMFCSGVGNVDGLRNKDILVRNHCRCLRLSAHKRLSFCPKLVCSLTCPGANCRKKLISMPTTVTRLLLLALLLLAFALQPMRWIAIQRVCRRMRRWRCDRYPQHCA